jgi:3-deoxy-D-manno-octulosonic-acid transferase
MAARKKKIMLLNGRISTRSFRGYKLLKPFVRRMLENFSLLCAQSEDDAERLIELGAQPARVKITGSAKYDLAGVPADIGDAFFKKLSAIGFGREKLLLVGGSTWRGEETALLEIYGRLRQRFPALRLILVPRHAERRNEVKAEIAARGYHFELWSHIHKRKPGSSETEVLLVDTTGELKSFYYASDLVFIGKSLKARGGQNPIEAAVCAKPVITGPHMENFAGVITDFLEAQAIIQVDDEQSLAEALTALLADESRRRLLGEHAQQVVLKKSGALQTSLELFLRVLKSDE